MNRATTFKMFWEAYPVKQAKQPAENVWDQLSGADRRAAYKGVSAYRDSCRRTGTTIAYPAKYLKQRRWEDVPTVTATKKEQLPVKSVGMFDEAEYSGMEVW